MESILRLTKKDFKIEYMIGHGNGGQNRQKVASACRITHEESGVSKYCQDHREQHRNRESAFKKLGNDPRFRSWLNQKVIEIESKEKIEKWVEEQMQPHNLKVEYI